MIKRNLDHPVMVDRDVINDKNLSLRSKGVWSIMKLINKTEITEEDIQQYANASLEGIKYGLEELKRFGYLE